MSASAIDGRWELVDGEPVFLSLEQVHARERALSLVPETLMCSRCGRVRPEYWFGVDELGPYGRSYYCTPCVLKWDPEWNVDEVLRLMRGRFTQ